MLGFSFRFIIDFFSPLKVLDAERRNLLAVCEPRLSGSKVFKPTDIAQVSTPPESGEWFELAYRGVTYHCNCVIAAPDFGGNRVVFFSSPC